MYNKKIQEQKISFYWIFQDYVNIWKNTSTLKHFKQEPVGTG